MPFDHAIHDPDASLNDISKQDRDEAVIMANDAARPQRQIDVTLSRWGCFGVKLHTIHARVPRPLV